MLRTVAALRQVDTGFDTSNVTKAEFQLPPTRYQLDFRRYPEAPEVQRFNDALLSRVASLPGVQSAALAGNQPLDVGFTNSFVIAGREAEAARWPEISIRRVTSGYFTTVRLQRVDGRLFTDSDAADAAPVALLNEAAVERFFPDRDPIGHQVAFWGATRRIVGVVRNERIHGIASPAPIALYVPLAQAPSIDGTESIVVRASADIGPALETAIRSIDPALAVFGVQALDDTASNSIREQQFLMQLLTAFAVIALLLAAIGIHGVLAYTIAQRNREIGIRIAVGATARDVVALVLGQSLGVTFVGLAAGIGLGLLLGRSLGAWLYGVSPADPLTVAAAVAVLGTIAAVSSYVPIRRAARIDPIAALKAE